MFCNGKYELVKKLGKGSFGEVYLVNDLDADQKNTESLIALKAYRYSFNSYSAFINAKNEEINLKMLENKYIVSYLKFFQELDSFFITLEYCEGGDLNQMIDSYKEEKILIPQTKLIQMFVEISKGLSYLHNNKIIHRDIKPSNIFLKNNQIKLGDFGLSIYLSSVSQAFSTNVGTPNYISPELIEGKGYDFKTDIWSAGCVFYELITLNKLFVGETFKDIIESIQNQNLPDLSYVYLKEVLVKMLIKNTKIRISSNQLVKKLENLSKLKKLNDFNARKSNICNKLVFKNKKYILHEKKSNESGFGIIFIVDDLKDYEKKVIKVFKNYQELDEYDQIKQEIVNLKQINCSNLVGILDFFVELNSFCTVQSFCNTSLEVFITKNFQAKNYLSEKNVLNISIQLIRAISILHSKNLIHKNIKPSNIFFHNECLKLGDYCFENNTEEIFNVTRKSGVLNYMSPECIRNETISTKSDIWSCGCVIYEIILNEKAFNEVTTMKLFDSIINKEPKQINSIYKSIEPVLKQMLDKDPTKRPESINILKKLLMIA